MKTKRNPYNSARTAKLLAKLPEWINQAPSGSLFKLLNPIGAESEVLSRYIDITKRNSVANTMDCSFPTNLKRVGGLPVRAMTYYGEFDDIRFTLNKVNSELELLDNVPTRLSYVSELVLDDKDLFISLKYMQNVPGAPDGFVGITKAHPADINGGLYIIDIEGNLLSQSPAGITEQSYDTAGKDEEIIFDDSNKAVLLHTPFLNTLHIYDVLNLTVDKEATEILTFTVSGNEVTWTGVQPPGSRYIAEYQYATYNGIRAIEPMHFEWDIAKYVEDKGLTVQYLVHDEFTYSGGSVADPSIAHTISGSTRSKSLSILGVEHYKVDDTVYYYIKLNPFEVRAGRTIDVVVTGTKVYEGTWNNPTINYTVTMPVVDSTFVDTSAAGIKIFDASDNDISSNFSFAVNLQTYQVTAYANTDFAGQQLRVNIYYHCTIDSTVTSDIILVENHTESFTDDNTAYYFTKADISPLVNESIVVPEVFQITATCAEEFVATVRPSSDLSFETGAYQVVAYLERLNQAIHFKEAYGIREHVHLLGASKDVNGVYATDIHKQFVPDFSGNPVEAGIWDYRDMVIYDDYIIVLRTSLLDYSDTISTASALDYGTSCLDFVNLFNRNIDFVATGLPQLGLSISIGPEDTIYLNVNATKTYPPELNVEPVQYSIIYKYKMHFDYILPIVEDDTMTAYIRGDLDKLITEVAD